MFWIFALAVVPTVGFLSARSSKLCGLLFSCLVFSTVLGDATNINFCSMESYRGPDRGFEVTLTDLLAAHGLAQITVRRAEQLPQPATGGKYRLVQPLADTPG